MKKTIVVTGANRGLGFALSTELAAYGHRVIAIGRSKDKLISAFKNIPGEIIPFVADVTQDNEIALVAKQVAEQFGSINVIVNNAGGIFESDPKDRLELNPIENFQQSLDLNLSGAYSVCRHFLPLINPNERGDIINISSRMGTLTAEAAVPNQEAFAYRVSKSALNAFTVHLANKLQGTNIFVNSTCPGWCSTDLGGPEAIRTPVQGIEDVLWLINENPKISGKFLGDKQLLPF